MNQKSKLYGLFVSVIKFGLVGGLCTVVSLAFYYLFIYCYMNYIVANTLSFLVGTVFGYFLNKSWVFKNRSRSYSSVWKFYVTYISSYLFSTGMLFVWVDQLQISDKIAPLINLCFTIPFNFIMSKIWVFKESKVVYEPNHTFVVCTYKESPYLEECIQSVLNQKISSKVIVATSTPNDYIKSIVEKYNLTLFVNEGPTGIQEDWNFAVSCCQTDFVTVCHHDDIYEKDYYSKIREVIESPIAKKTLLIHTGYYDINQDDVRSITVNNKIKRRINLINTFGFLQSSKFVRKITLAFGNTVCCPSCTYNKKLLGPNFFNSDLTHCCDWDMYYKISRMRGRVVYISDKIMSKRYHSGSQTVEDIKSGKRFREDKIMFEKFWPEFIVKRIMKKYVNAYKINE